MELNSFLAKFSNLERKILKLLFYLLCFSLALWLVAGYFKNTKLFPAYGGNYREGVVGGINQINPILSFNNNIERDLVKFLYPSLMVSALEYGLADSFSVSPDQKEYIFSLRPDAKWQDGTSISADDVIFTFELIKNPLYKSPLRSNWEEVKIEKISDFQVKFILPNPYSLFIENLTTGILPKHIWQEISPDDFAKSSLNLEVLSGGPYILKNIVKKGTKIKAIKLERNRNYFGFKPYIDYVTINFYDSEKELLESLERGAIDGALLRETENFAPLKDWKNFNLFHLKYPRYYALFFNQEKNNTLKIAKIREVIALAIDKRELIRKIFDGYAEFISTPIPINGYFDIGLINSLDYDIQKAKILLEDLTSGKNKPDLKIDLAAPKDKTLLKVANFIKDSLEKIGFAIKIEPFDTKTLFESIIKDRDYQMLLFGHALRSNPDPFSFWHSSQVRDPGLNLALYKNPEVDKILVEARQTSDAQRRKDLYQKFQEQIIKDIPAIFLYRPVELYAINNKIKGIAISDLISSPDERFNNFSKWYLKQKRSRATAQ